MSNYKTLAHRFSAAAAVVLLAWLASPAAAQIETQTTAGSVLAQGGSWSNLNNAASLGGGCAFPDNNPPTALDLEDWGFSIPAAATIVGIEVRVRGASTAGDNTITLLKAGAPVGSGQNAAISGGGCPGTEDTVGGPTDLFGTTWTPAEINAAGFGVRYAPQFQGRQFDGAEISVYYSDPSAGADLAITKTGPANAVAGEQITYTIEVTNNGPSDATNVIVDETPPVGLTFASADAPCAGGFPCNLGTLAPSAAASFDVTFDIDPAAAGTLDNSASVASDASDPNTANDSDSVTTQVAAEADLAITKTGPANAVAGEQITYTIEVTNNGPSDATNVIVDETPPVGLTFASADAPCAGGFPCNLGTLAPSAAASFDVTFDIDPAAAGTLDNSASVASDASDPNAANDSDSVTTQVAAEADLAITKTGPANAVAGEQITYTIEVTNNGPSDATNVIVDETPPVGLTFASADAPCAGGFPCNLGTLAPSAAASFDVTFDIDPAAAGTLDNSASVASDASDPNAANDSDSVTTQVAAEADLAITKTGPANAVAGEQITYTIEVTNNGPSDATNVIVDETPPVGLTFASADAPCAGGFPCNLGTLAPSAAASFDVTFDIDPAAAGTLDNSASVASDASDPNTANDTDSASSTIDTVADLSISKTDNQTLINPGDFVTYTIVASNAGPSAVTDAVVTDIFQLPLIDCFWGTMGSGGAFGPTSGVGDINEVIGLPPGATLTFTAQCGTLFTSGPVINSATISSASATDPNGSNDAAVDDDTRLDEVRPIPVLDLWALWLLMGLIATIGLARARNTG